MILTIIKRKNMKTETELDFLIGMECEYKYKDASGSECIFGKITKIYREEIWLYIVIKLDVGTNNIIIANITSALIHVNNDKNVIILNK